MMPIYHTSIAELPNALRAVLHELATDMEQLLQHCGMRDNISTALRFSWAEGGEQLITCRATVRGTLCEPGQDQFVTVGVMITEEHGRRNLITADAFQDTWYVLAEVSGMTPRIQDGDAVVGLPLSALLQRTH